MSTTETKPPLAQELDKVAEGTSSSASMTVNIGSDSLQFKFKKKTDGELSSVVAYSSKLENAQIPVGDTIALISPEIASLLPEKIQQQAIAFNQLIVIYSKEKKKENSKKGGNEKEEPKAKWLFLLDIGLADPFTFADLPLIGDAFQGTSIGATTFLPSLRLIAASKPFTLKETRYYNENLLTDDEDEDEDNEDETEDEEEETAVEKLPDPGKDKGEDDDIMIRKGVSLSGKLEIGVYPFFFNLPVSPETSEEEIPDAPNNASASVGKYGLWFEVDRAIICVTIFKVGIVYDRQDYTLALLFDAAIDVGPFTLSAEKLGVKLSFVDSFRANFTIDGAGVVYITKRIKLAGALLYTEKTLNDIHYKEFVGLAAVKFKLSSKGSDGQKKGFGISAIGSYAYYNKKPALFFYACLDYALGGPGFCFVTGFSFGLGYNRFLQVPEIDGIREFPLVAQAINGSTNKKVEDTSALIKKQLEDLDDYVTLSPGSGFIAMGLKFTSYKLVDSFALLSIAIGEDFEINALGIASMKIPPDIPGEESKVQPLAKLTMLLKTRFSLEDMLISIEAQVASDSYILSKKCVLTGGFAFYLWFDGTHAGDFVISLGGYHPEFKKPAHYPSVPRLGFHWQVEKALSLKGEMYFALCSHTFMAGGKFEACFRAGTLWVNYVAEVHFLISWKPYYYDILIQVRVEAAIGFVGPACLGIKLHLWGPDFGGTASFKIIFVSVTMSFGDRNSRYPTPIDWTDFRESFLPSDPEVCTALITEGVTRQLWNKDGSPLFIVNSEEFELVTDSVIPTKEAFFQDKTIVPDKGGINRSFGVPSMGIVDHDIKTSQQIEIFRITDDTKKNVDKADWHFEPITKDIPTALWGEARVITKKQKEYLLPPETNDAMFLENTLSGFRITPAERTSLAKTTTVKTEALAHNTQCTQDAYAWEKVSPFGASVAANKQRTETIQKSLVDTTTESKRNSILCQLGFDPTTDVQLTPAVAEDFVIAPQVNKIL